MNDSLAVATVNICLSHTHARVPYFGPHFWLLCAYLIAILVQRQILGPL